MRLLRSLTISALFVFAAALSSSTAHAIDTSNRGLAVSPLRQEKTVKVGVSSAGYFTIANYTNKPMIVDLSVQQFSVTDFIYDYKFLAPPKNDWVALREAQVTIQANKSKKIWYDIKVPAKTTPGGYYFSLFASTKVEGDGLPGTIQAASLLYVVVDGKLIKTSILQNDWIPFVVTGNNIPYKFDVKNTGNVHFSAYFYGQLSGILFGKDNEVGTGHILMPGVTRSIEGSVPTPLMPGVYKVTYGYKVDFAPIVTTKTAYILFIPPWSLVALLFLLLGGRWIWQRNIAAKKKE